jgi:exocyst complex component 7
MKFQGRTAETPGKRASKRLQQAIEKKATNMFQKASKTLEQSTGLSLGPRRSGINLGKKRTV